MPVVHLMTCATCETESVSIGEDAPWARIHWDSMARWCPECGGRRDVATSFDRPNVLFWPEAAAMYDQVKAEGL